MHLRRSGALYPLLRRLRSRGIAEAKGLRHVHPTCYFHPSARISRDLVAEPYAFVGRDCEIGPLVTIGRYSMLASRVAIIGGDHVSDSPGTPMQFTGRPDQEPTLIGRDVWIGHASVIMRGVTIGDGAIVGAGAVVTRNVPPYEVWAGTPARYIRRRFRSTDEDATHRAMLQGPLTRPRFAEPL